MAHQRLALPLKYLAVEEHSRISSRHPTHKEIRHNKITKTDDHLSVRAITLTFIKDTKSERMRFTMMDEQVLKSNNSVN